MKPNPEPEAEARLDRVLREWTVATPLPPRFAQQVWRRIEQADAPAAPFWASWLRLLEAALPRPAIAAVYLAGLLVLGLAAGAWAAQVKTSRLQASLSLRYVQSLDPYR